MLYSRRRPERAAREVFRGDGAEKDFCKSASFRKRIKPPAKSAFRSFAGGLKNGGERGIRTPGTFRLNGFQDRRNRPLCHLSVKTVLQAKKIRVRLARKFPEARAARSERVPAFFVCRGGGEGVDFQNPPVRRFNPSF